MIPLVLHTGTANFSWTEWHLHPDVILLVAALLAAYGAAWRWGMTRGYVLKTRHVLLYLSGVAAIYTAAGTPIHDLSEQYLFSVHMVQHMLFTLVAPPLLLAGTTDWMWRPLLRPTWALRTARFFVKPVVAIALFNGTTIVTHLPIVMDFSLRHHPAHFTVHAILITTAVSMWWLVFSPLPELPRLKEPWRLGYLFIQSIVPTVPASFLTFSDSVIYRFYATAPEIWGVSAIQDQRISGLTMKLGGGLLLWSVITVLFFLWYEEEEAEGATKRLPRWKDTEKELKRMGLTKR